MKYLKSDSDERILKGQDDLERYFSFRKEYDKWVTTPIDTCSVVAIENNPLFAGMAMEELGIENTEELNFSNMECINDSGLFLRFPLDGEKATMPTRFTAFRGLLERAGLKGETMANYVSSKKKKVLPVKTKAEWLTIAMQLYSADTKILIRDEKVTAMLSEDYAILPVYELIPELEESCRKTYSNMFFSGGTVTHEYFTAEYRLNDEAADDSFKQLLMDIEMVDKKSDIACGICFITSDVGLSRVAAYPAIIIGDRAIRFGKGISVLHKGNNDLDVFRKQLKSISSLFDEAEEQVERLGNMHIPNIKACVEAIVADTTVFSKKAAEKIINTMLPVSGTAIDVYFSLYDIAEEMTIGKGAGYKLDVLDNVSKFLYLDYKKYI